MPPSAEQSIRKASRLAKAGQPLEAAALYNAVLEKFPGNRRAREALAALAPSPPRETLEQLVALSKSGALEGATELAASLARRFPDSVDLHNILGINLLKLGRLEDARARFETALKLKPDFAEPHASLGKTLRRLGRAEDALASYREALRLDPAHAAARNNLGEALCYLGRYEEAEAELRRVIENNPALAPAHNNLGNALKNLGRHGDAIEAYETAVALDPLFADAHKNLGVALTDLGRRKDAAAAFEKAIEAKPDFARAHRNLIAVKTCKAGDPQIAQMEALLSRGGLIPDDRAQIHFALGKALDDIGDYATAFGHFREGNRLRKELLGYSIETDRELFRQIKAAFPNPKCTVSLSSEISPPDNPGESRAPEHASDWIPASAGKIGACSSHQSIVDPAPIPVFIVGMPRSGTSLTEQILASHPDVCGGGELELLENIIAPNGALIDDCSPARFEDIRTRYLAGIKKLAGDKPFVTDKLPLNFRWIGHIRTALPEAKIVHVERDPRAVCWSIFKHYFASRGNAYAYDLGDLGDYCALHQDLMAYWRTLFGDCIYRLDYERLTENQEAETRELLAHVGLEWNGACLDFHKTDRAVATASNLQVRKALYSGSSETWRNYAPFLGPLAEKLSAIK